MILQQCASWNALNKLQAPYRHLYRLLWLPELITNTIKITISLADILADPIIGTSLVKSQKLLCKLLRMLLCYVEYT